MNNAKAFIAGRLPEVQVDDIRRRFRAIEIRDENMFAVELRQYVLESVAMLASGLPDDVLSDAEASSSLGGMIVELPSAMRAAALRRDLS